MIIVHAVLVPHGDPESTKETLCTLTITNDGTGTLSRRNYRVDLFSRGEKPHKIKTARVRDYPANAKAAYHLIAKAFIALANN